MSTSTLLTTEDFRTAPDGTMVIVEVDRLATVATTNKRIRALVGRVDGTPVVAITDRATEIMIAPLLGQGSAPRIDLNAWRILWAGDDATAKGVRV